MIFILLHLYQQDIQVYNTKYTSQQCTVLISLKIAKTPVSWHKYMGITAIGTTALSSQIETQVHRPASQKRATDVTWL